MNTNAPTRDRRTLSEDVRAMHAAYVKGTGLELALTMPNTFAWEVLWAEGVTAADVVLVIGHLRRKAARQQAARGFRFSTFVGRADLFLEDLAEARALNRVQRPDRNLAAARLATGRPAAEPPPPARPVGEVISSERFQAELQRLKEELG